MQSLTYQLLMYGYGPYIAVTGPGDKCRTPEKEREKRLLHLRTAAGA